MDLDLRKTCEGLKPNMRGFSLPNIHLWGEIVALSRDQYPKKNLTVQLIPVDMITWFIGGLTITQYGQFINLPVTNLVG